MSILKTIVVLLIPFLSSLQGCPEFDIDLKLRVFSHPLVVPEHAVCPIELIGTFVRQQEPPIKGHVKGVELDFGNEIGETPESISPTVFLHVGRAGGKLPNGFLRVVSVNVPNNRNETIHTSSEIFFVSRLGQRYIAHFPVVNGELFGKRDLWNAGECQGYLLMDIRVDNDRIELRALNAELIDKLVASGELKLGHKENGKHLITSTADSVKELIETHGDSMFDRECDCFKRVKLKDHSDPCISGIDFRLLERSLN